MTDADLAFVLILACVALLCDALWPAQRKRGWDNTRAATQRDVAEVLKGRRNQTGPNVTGLLLFGLASWLLYVLLFAD